MGFYVGTEGEHIGRHRQPVEHDWMITCRVATATGSQPTRNDTTTTLAGTDVYSFDAVGQRVPATPAVPTALLALITRVQAAR